MADGSVALRSWPSIARGRRKKVTSVKANVLASPVARGDPWWPQYPDVVCEDVLVDACAMYLINRLADFDVM
jgi:isocitrate/isopropylmalate dehydrogenase